MKTFDEIFTEVVADKSISAKGVFEEIAKRYAIQSLQEIVSEVERRRDIIISEPNGTIRETMIQNLAINL